MNDNKPKKQIPSWISAAAIALVALIGAWLLWRYWAGAPFGNHEVFGQDDPPSAHVHDAPVVPDGIRQPRPNVWNVRAGLNAMQVTKQKDGNFAFNLSYVNLLDASQQSILSARWRIPRDQAVAKTLNVSAEQIDKLKKLPGGARGGAEMALEPADTERMKALWSAYASSQPGAAHDQAQADVIGCLSDLGTKKIEPTKRAIDQRVDAIKAILTPQQVENFAKLGR